ncbi:helix-turn-helix domain-containing protein [Sinorhizobium meliloti]|nr:helix-turn-helix domain-containing protein [Sinorhizobium meliloti]MDW9918499.1 helix-turn-helix domain-containing protein [Sinorhizobium meliloti]MDW9949645.1 helix-turn-helix domain-containing protein [Sinorhizobium meliloti]
MAPNVGPVQGREQIKLPAPPEFRSPDSVDRSFFEGTGAVTFLRDSQTLGWEGAYAALTLEQPHEAYRRPVSAVWFAVSVDQTSLRRIIRGREDYDPAIPSSAITITPPGEEVRDVIGMAAKALHVFLSRDIMNEVAREMIGERAEGVSVAPAFCIDDPGMMPLLSTIEQALHDPPSEASLKVDYLTRALAAHVLRTQNVAARAEPAARSRYDLAPRQLQLLQDYIQNNLSREISIADLADLLGLSRAQFLRCFKGSTGTSPHQYVMAARVQRARGLLKDAAMNLAAVAATSGFANPAHLTTVFSRFMNVTPSEYRRQVL